MIAINLAVASVCVLWHTTMCRVCLPALNYYTINHFETKHWLVSSSRRPCFGFKTMKLYVKYHLFRHSSSVKLKCQLLHQDTCNCSYFVRLVCFSDDQEEVVHSDDAFAPVAFLHFKSMHLEKKDLVGNLLSHYQVLFPPKKLF